MKWTDYKCLIIANLRLKVWFGSQHNTTFLHIKRDADDTSDGQQVTATRFNVSLTARTSQCHQSPGKVERHSSSSTHLTDTGRHLLYGITCHPTQVNTP